MKKMFAVLLALCMVLTCLTMASAEEKTYHVGILQLVQHEALDAATKGFRDALTEKLGDKVVFDEQNASGDTASCAMIANGFVAAEVDLIMANATPALQAAVSATADIPILGTSISHYGTALEISDWKGYTEINVSGTSDLAPLDGQANMIVELFPEAKTVALLYCSAEANSAYQIGVVKAELEAKGITCKEYAFTDSNDVRPWRSRRLNATCSTSRRTTPPLPTAKRLPTSSCRRKCRSSRVRKAFAAAAVPRR